MRAKRLILIVVGSTLLLLGVALLVLPGPGIATIVLALTLLATEFVWARRLLRRSRVRAERFRRAARRTFGDSRRSKAAERTES